MVYHCKQIDISIKNKSEYNRLKSKGHKLLDESNITRYIIKDSNINDIDEIVRKKINIYKKLRDIWSVVYSNV